MIDHLAGLARALHRAGDGDEAARLLELAAVATMHATALDALRRPAAADRPGPAREPGEAPAPPARLAA